MNDVKVNPTDIVNFVTTTVKAIGYACIPVGFGMAMMAYGVRSWRWAFCDERYIITHVKPNSE